jgi:hypothetical protein
MAENLLATLQAIDPAHLTHVVRQDQSSPAFEITQWSVTRLSDKGIINPEGLWVFAGAGRDSQGERSWSVVLKILNRQDSEPPPSDMWYWKRELLVAQSGLTQRLPGPVKAPRFYQSGEPLDGTWLWMEHIHDARPGPWSLHTHMFAARELGRWNGAFVLAGPPPDEPWLGRRHYRTWLNWVDADRDWQFPLLQKHVSAELRARWDRLWADRDAFFRTLETMPQVFCHADAQRRNLAIRPGSGQADELVALDWALCGLAPLGVEMAMFVFGNIILVEWQASAARELDAAASSAYIDGLREAGWQGDLAQVRLAYTAWISVMLGLATPFGMSHVCTAEARDDSLRRYRMAEEELFLQFLSGMVYALDCADEARVLMSRLGM